MTVTLINPHEDLTVTLTLTLSGPTAVETAHHLVQSLGHNAVSTWDGLVVESGEQLEAAGQTCMIDTVSRNVFVNGAAVPFTRREYDLLLFLVGHSGAAFTRRQLLRAVWGHEFSGERTVDVHVRRLRSKLEGHGPLISTVHGFGYRLEHPERALIRR